MNNIEELKTKLEKARSNARKLDNQIAAMQDEIKKLEEGNVFERVKRGQFYFYIDVYGGKFVVGETEECYSSSDTEYFNYNNYFISRERAQEVADHLNQLMCVERVCDEYPEYKINSEIRVNAPNCEISQKVYNILDKKINQ